MLPTTGMEQFPLFSAVIVVAAVFSYLNHRFIKLPTTVGVMAIALGVSLLLLLVDLTGIDVREPAVDFLEDLRFRETLLDGMLAFLLFAGALHVDLGLLLGQKKVVLSLATVGVVVTTILVGVFGWLATQAFGLDVPFTHMLLFGAIISPTDPIAVLGILKKAGVPKSLEAKIVGESLFNDGIAMVVFPIALGLAAASGEGHTLHLGSLLLHLLQEVGGSLILGLLAGWVVYRMLLTVENYQVEVLLTLALAMGLYTFAGAIHTSGPLAVVVAGLLIGNTGRQFAMDEHTRQHLDTFWELVDEILNALLFVLIGLEVLVIDFDPLYLVLAIVAIPLVLVARFTSVGGAIQALRRFRTFSPHVVKIMTWGGLRGGISVALALAVTPDVGSRDLILTMTYIVVVFSILVQGLTVGRLAKR